MSAVADALTVVVCTVLLSALSDARAKVRQLALMIVADTQPPTNLRLLEHVVELTGKEENKQKWGQPARSSSSSSTSTPHSTSTQAFKRTATIDLTSHLSLPQSSHLSFSSHVPSFFLDLCVAAKYIELGLKAFEQAVSFTAGTYSFGNNITFADLCLIPQLFNARRYGVDLAQFPTITRIESALSSHPAFVAAHPDAQPDNPAKK